MRQLHGAWGASTTSQEQLQLRWIPRKASCVSTCVAVRTCHGVFHLLQLVLRAAGPQQVQHLCSAVRHGPAHTSDRMCTRGRAVCLRPGHCAAGAHPLAVRLQRLELALDKVLICRQRCSMCAAGSRSRWRHLLDGMQSKC